MQNIFKFELRHFAHLAIFLTIAHFTVACTGQLGGISSSPTSEGGSSTKTTGPQGNGSGYGGGDYIDEILANGLKDVQTALQVAETAGEALCRYESYCASTMQTKSMYDLCSAIYRLDENQTKECSAFVRNYGQKLRQLASVPISERFIISEEPLKETSFGGSAQVELSSNGKIKLYRKELYRLPSPSLIALLIHEFGHMIDLGNGKHILDASAYGTFEGENGGRRFLDALGASISLNHSSKLYENLIKEAKPLAYWPMDESFGEMLNKQWRDLSGNDRPLKCEVKKMEFISPNDVGGLSMNYEFRLFHDFKGAIPSEPNSAVSLEFWINRAANSQLGSLLNSNFGGFPLRMNVIGMFLAGGMGTHEVDYTQGEMHVVAVWTNGGNKPIRLFIDGRERTLQMVSELKVASGITSDLIWPAQNLDFVVRMYKAAHFTFKNSFHQMSVYDYALSEDTISKHYRARAFLSD